MLFHIQGLFEQIDAMTKAATGNFQGDYFCGSGIGFDDGQAMPMDASTPGTNDGKDGGMPVICKTQSLFCNEFLERIHTLVIFQRNSRDPLP